MNKTILEIKKLELENFQPKGETVDIKVTFQKNQETNTITENFKIKDPYKITRKLLIKIKSTGKFIVEQQSDDVLENIFITQLMNEEDIEEKLLLFFKDLCQKIQILRGTKVAKEYMRKVDQIKILKLLF